MIALQIKENKTFMSKLLATDVFDCFLLEETTITTFNTFFIDGRRVNDFYTLEELENEISLPEFSPWSTMRPICFDLIKGKKAPVNFKFVFHLSPETLASITAMPDCSVDFPDVKALVLTIKFDGSTITCISATAFHSFVLDKSLDLLWDIWVKRFLSDSSITFEQM